MADEKHYDSKGYFSGSTDSNGRHYDSKGYFSGSTDSNGRHYDSKGYFSGSTDSNGRHYDSGGYFSGSTDSNGRHYDSGGYFSGSSSSSSGGCYLTTACVEARGLADDCHELATLRRFRDEYVRSRPEGEALVAEYYDQAPPLVATISARADGKQIFEGIYAEIAQAVQHIERNELEAALELYITTTRRLYVTYGGQ
jgi:hypothetical protein